MQVALTEQHAGCTIQIVQDECAENPLTTYEDFIKVVEFHPNYNLGNCNDFADPHAFEDWCKGRRVTRLPLYLYDHSGLRVNTSGFQCPWDSGQIGWVYADHADARKWCGWSRVTAKRREQLLKQMQRTVDMLDNYLVGHNYGYRVLHQGFEVDACWGFTCEPDGYILEDARYAAANAPGVQLQLAGVA